MPDNSAYKNGTFTLHMGSEKWHQASAFFVRMEVFVLERNIPLQDEFDDLDTDERVYAVIYDGDKPVATGRIIQEEETIVRPGRIAVLKEHRGKRLGEWIIKEIEAYSIKEGCTQSVIHGELSAAGFYEKLGYSRVSDVYEEDGVPCVTLKKDLDSSQFI